MSRMEKRISEMELDQAAALEDADEETAKNLIQLPGWLREFYLNITACLESPPTWRNPAPSLFQTGECSEYLEVLEAGHLNKLIQGDRWMFQILAMILRTAAERHLQAELGIDEEQAKTELQLILKHRGYGCYLPDSQDFNRLSPAAQKYLVKAGLKR